MIRVDLDPDAPQISVTLRSDGRLAVMTRSSAGQVASTLITESSVGSSRWLRLSRQNNTVILEHSNDGLTWQEITTVNIFLPNITYLGLVVSGQGDDYTPVQADFSQVSGSHQSGVLTLQTDIDLGMKLNTPANLYVVIQDSSNQTATLYHPNNPNAILQNFWDTWTIPLGTVSGVNLSRVQKLIIGVDNRNNPQLSGTGRVFIDDIGLTE
jgi:hypothetical protein